MEEYRNVIGIYKITNPVGEVYIGQSTNILKRFYSHKLNYGGLKLKESIKKYGFENHTFELKEECEKHLLSEREKFYINLYDSINKGLNIRGDKKEKVVLNNERNAGRKKKYNVPVKLIRVPNPIIETINELSKPYETTKKNIKRQ